jgi:hypothetical protein
MILRLIVIAVALLLAIGGFLGASPIPGGPLNPFGLLFLGVAALVWFAWKPMKGGLESRPGLLDGVTPNFLGMRNRETSSGNSAS